jgi:Tol biopolymer transport system component
VKAAILVSLAALLLGLVAANRLRAQEFQNQRIFVADKDGTNAKPIVEIPGMVSHGSPHWSNDGKLMVFDAIPEPRKFALNRLYVFAVGGPFKGTWKHFGTGGAARFSPDNNQIAFQVRPGNPEGLEAGIWVMRDDGTNRRRICDGLKPRWTRDGRSLLFTSNVAEGVALEMINLDGSGRRRVVTETYGAIAACDTSPDGKSVCFIGYPIRPYDGALYKAPLTEDGSAESTAIYRGRVGWSPAWAPDGRQIMFWQMDDAGSRHICIIDVDGREAPKKLADQEGTRYNSDAEWSPDGRQIAFASDRAAAATQGGK